MSTPESQPPGDLTADQLRRQVAILRGERRLLRILLAWQLGTGDGYQAVAAAGMTGDQLLAYLLGELRAGEAITEGYPTPLSVKQRPRRGLEEVQP